ncbi:MAG: leucine-rich repeat protein [Oscillospiraceae bacterium]|nr:leucine-rich repeat protein [Oscillospiraceae bacterium]
MKSKRITAILLSAATLAAMPVTPVLRDTWQTASVTAEAASTPAPLYEYTTGGIVYQLDTSNKEAYVKSYTGSPTNLIIRATVNYANGAYKIVGIRDNAFNGCSSLTTVDLSSASNLRSIGTGAFRYSSVRNVFINSSVTVNSYAFANTGSLQSVTLQAYGTTVRIKPNAFYQSSIQDFYGYAPNIYLEKEAFWQCMNLSYVRFNSNVKNLSLGDNLFFKLWNLKTLRIEGTSTKVTLGKNTFMSSGISSISLPNTVTEIPEGCFSGMQITSFTMPDSVKTIGKEAFSSTTLPATFKISKNVETIDEYAFSYAYGVQAYTLNGSKDGSNAYYKTVDGVLYNKSGDTLFAYPQKKTNTSFTTDAKYIPNGVIHNNTYLQTLTLNKFIMTYSKYTAYFPGLSNLKNLTIAPSEYSQGAWGILDQYKTLFTDTQVNRLNGQDIVRLMASGEPTFGTKFANEMDARFELYEYYYFMKYYVDKMAGFVVKTTTNSSMTTLQKAIRLRAWIMGRVEYDHEAKDDKKNHVDASVFLHKKNGKYYTVCDGYARCYDILLNKAGIQSYYVCDPKFGREDEEGHAWNLFKLNGHYYHADVTWDDGVTGNTRFDNFLCSDAQFDNDGHKTYNWSAWGDRSICKGKGYADMDNRKLGDVNGDGKFNSTDVTKLKSYIGTTNKTYLARCDLDFNGKVDTVDANLLQQYINSEYKNYSTVRLWRLVSNQ